ncbi:hypothetical protein D1872_275490 [compost metagenome]
MFRAFPPALRQFEDPVDVGAVQTRPVLGKRGIQTAANAFLAFLPDKLRKSVGAAYMAAGDRQVFRLRSHERQSFLPA